MDQAASGFHAFAANAGLASCQGCHGPALDGTGTAAVSCAACHGAGWTSNCVLCHGGTENRTGAPPRATWGRAGDPVRIGAHTAHVTASDAAPAFDCDQCHAKPTDALSEGHIDGPTATVTFGGLAVKWTTPAWDRGSATCSSTYCHGATLPGGTNKAPAWTGGAEQAACGTCHGVPPPPPHPAVTTGAAGCSTCHPATVDTAGALIPPAAGGKHLDGLLEVTSFHGATWTDPASSGFHAFSANAGLGACQACHGADLSGGSAGVSCAQCHGSDWKTSCVTCHGGKDDLTGAPPRTTWGNGADAVRIGAHGAHVRAAHGLSRPIDCALCHLKPQDAFSPGHIDEATASVSFAGLAAQGTAPAWDRASASCSSTYCHGATLAGGTNKSPRWTSVDGSERACEACHGAPPANAHHARADLDCSACHGTGYSALAGTVAPATHVDGKLDLSLTCTSCHGDPARAASIAAAPPSGTHGETAATSRAVGAHLQHLQGGILAAPIACGECHAVPTSTVHADGTPALTWGPLARTGGSVPAWSAASATCSSNWCHGAKLTGGRDTTPIWTTVNGTQDACGTCHGLPPSSGRHGQSEHRVSCGYCHASGYSSTTVSAALHVDGKLEVQGTRIRTWNATTKACQPTCHGTETWSGH